jgi:hypothetical protein
MQPTLPLAPALKKLRALLLCLPLLVGCEDAADHLFPQPQPVQLPAETKVGANTFGCLVNEQVWEASNATTLAGNVLTPSASYQRGELHIDAFRRLQVAGPITNFYFTAAHVTGPGVYPLLQGHSARLETLNRRFGYVADTLRAGTLTVTRLDTTGPHPLVAGRFALRAVLRPGAGQSADFPAEVHVTEGRFDIQLNRR